MTTSSGLNVYDAMRDTILIGVNLRNFRNGAFSNLITKDTPVVDAMNILIASSCLSSSEKEIVRSCRDEFIAFRNRFPGDQTPGIFDAIKLMGSTEKMMAPVLSQKVVFMVCRLVLLTGLLPCRRRIRSYSRTVRRDRPPNVSIYLPGLWGSSAN
jgi:hypothetical protein